MKEILIRKIQILLVNSKKKNRLTVTATRLKNFLRDEL